MELWGCHLNTLVALFRGMNVGGHNKIRMADLRSILESVGCRNPRTYIQSGNAVFGIDNAVVAADGVTFERSISAAIEADHGFAPHILILERDEFEGAADRNPYPVASDEPKTVHLYFFHGVPAAQAEERLESVRAADESFSLTHSVLYVHAPSGIARSELVAKVDHLLGVPATGRNWRTIRKIRELLDEAAS